nr:unnamed protein product [Digitaria exilis]
MFVLRIQSVDFPTAVAGDEVGTSSGGGAATSRPLSPPSTHPHPSTTSSSILPLELPGATSATPARSPRIQHTRGVIHLYHSSSSTSTSSSSYASAVAATSSSSSVPAASDSLLPPWRCMRLLVLAVPTRVSPDDFVRFCGPYLERASDIRFIRDDGVEDRYSVLVEFEDQKSADGFYLDLNGWRFSSSEYYEGLLSETKRNKERLISEAVDKAVNDKLQELQLKLENLVVEKKKVADTNEKLTRSQDMWRQTLRDIEEREKAQLKSKDETIRDLEEQIKDFRFSIKVQKSIEKNDGIKGGTLVPLATVSDCGGKGKRSSRTSKRRN